MKSINYAKCAAGETETETPGYTMHGNGEKPQSLVWAVSDGAEL